MLMMASWREFAVALPKAELHAHLHGSIRPSTLVELLSSASHVPSTAAEAVVRDVLPSPNRSLSDCFRIFDVIHGVVNDETVVRRIVREMVHDCAADGVSYLEIRTTPRPLPSAREGMVPMESYVRAVVETLAEVEHSCGDRLGITVRLLLSVNRTGTMEAAEETVGLAERYSRVTVPVSSAFQRGCAPCAECARVRGTGSLQGDPCGAAPVGTGASPRHAAGLPSPSASSSSPTPASAVYGPYVVGLDLSGDPTRGSALAFLPLLGRVRSGGGLRVSVHCGEVMNVREAAGVVEWGPDRLGHMCVCAPSTVAALLARPGPARIPIEVCPTSNALTLHLPSLHHHPTISPWLAEGYPIALATDDSGVFRVALSDEYADVAETYSLSRHALARLALASFEYAFVDAHTRRGLRAAAEGRIRALLPEFEMQGDDR